MRNPLAAATQPTTEFTFETTLAATAAALVIAFAALRWIRSARTSQPQSPVLVLLRRLELLVTMTASIGAVIVIFVALDALAKGVELGPDDRNATVNVLRVALWLFFLGVGAERIGGLLERQRTLEGELTPPYGDQIYAAFLGIVVTLLLSLSAYVASDSRRLAIGLGIALALGLLAWGTAGRVSRGGRRKARQQFLAFCQDEGLEAGTLFGPGQDFDAVAVLVHPTSKTVYLTTPAAQHLAHEYERTRLQTTKARDIKLEWRPFARRLRVQNERLGSEALQSVPLKHGLVRLDPCPRHVLGLDIS